MAIASGQVPQGIMPIYGTYNPIITGATSGGFNLDPSINTLSYVKIGRFVHVQGYISITSEDSCVGSIRVSLPFEVANLAESSDYTLGTANIRYHGGSIPNLFIEPNPGTTNGYLIYWNDDGTGGNLTSAMVDTEWYLSFSLQYISAN